VGLGREGFTQVVSGVGWSAATGVGLSWRSVRESGSSCSERERDEEDDAEAVAEEEQRMVAAGRGLGLRWLRLRRGGEQRGEASQWGGLQRRRGSVRERKGGGTHLSAHDAVVLPAEPRGAEPRDVVALTGFLG
jgi:hypothetical protein